MKAIQVGSMLGLLAMAGAAQAGLSATATVTNDYDFRGITQSAEDPALQGSVDFTHDSGWYVGAWGSNVDFGDDTDFELDLYGGITGKTDMGLAWDAGLVVYTYDESKYRFPEVFTAFTYQWFKAKLAYSNDFGGKSDFPPRHRSGWYVSGDATVPLPANFSALGHVGYSFGSYWTQENNPYDDYVDYSLGVGYTLEKFNLTLRYVNTHNSGKPYVTSDVGNNEARLVLAISTTFPW